MKKAFSTKWVSSTQPRKQRKYRFNAPLHKRQKMIACHLDEKLMEEFKTRSLTPRKGDKVLIMRGDYRKLSGEITSVNLSKCKVYIDCAKVKKTSGKEVQVPIDPSNIKIIEIKKEDKKRQKIFDRKVKKAVIAKEKK